MTIKQKTLWHYGKMIKWAKKQNPDERVSRGKMYSEISQNWSGRHCELCKKFGIQGPLAIDCQGCPLFIAGHGCNEPGSLWRRLNRLQSWGQWVIEAEALFCVLKTINYDVEPIGRFPAGAIVNMPIIPIPEEGGEIVIPTPFRLNPERTQELHRALEQANPLWTLENVHERAINDRIDQMKRDNEERLKKSGWFSPEEMREIMLALQSIDSPAAWSICHRIQERLNVQS